MCRKFVFKDTFIYIVLSRDNKKTAESGGFFKCCNLVLFIYSRVQENHYEEA